MVALASSPAVPRVPRPPLALSPTASVIKTEQLRRSYNGRVLFTLRDFRREDFETLWRIDQSCFPPGISYAVFCLKKKKKTSTIVLRTETRRIKSSDTARHNQTKQTA